MVCGSIRRKRAVTKYIMMQTTGGGVLHHSEPNRTGEDEYPASRLICVALHWVRVGRRRDTLICDLVTPYRAMHTIPETEKHGGTQS